MPACSTSSAAIESLRRRCCPRAVPPLARRRAFGARTDPHRDDAHAVLLMTPTLHGSFAALTGDPVRLVLRSGVDGGGRWGGESLRCRGQPASARPDADDDERIAGLQGSAFFFDAVAAAKA